MTSRDFSFQRRNGARLAPLAAMFAALIVSTRGSEPIELTVLATILFLAALGVGWWVWNVPLLEVRGNILVWREVPQTTRRVVLDEVSDWRYDSETLMLTFHTANETEVELNLKVARLDDVPVIVDIVKDYCS